MKSRLHVLGTRVNELVYDKRHICSFQTAKLGTQCLSDSLLRTCVTCQIHSERKSRRRCGESSHRDSPFFQMCRTGCKRAFPEQFGHMACDLFEDRLCFTRKVRYSIHEGICEPQLGILQGRNYFVNKINILLCDAPWIMILEHKSSRIAGERCRKFTVAIEFVERFSKNFNFQIIWGNL